MAHLKKDGVTGHLLKTPGGHLVKTCPAGSPCNACSPQLALTYTVTLGGLAGSFAWANGVHVVNYQPLWANGCWWSLPNMGGPGWTVQLYWPVATGWYVGIFLADALGLPVNCYHVWQKGGALTPCNPLGAYAFNICVDFDPACNPASCAGSAGATCVVAP